MAARPPQASVTSLARYAVAKQPGVDLFNGKPNRDYCNAFWGAGDAGPNLVFARMRGASKTTDELRNFWNERCIIEEEYAAKLAKLAKVPIGGDEIGELRNSLDTLRMETETEAQNHLKLAHQIRAEMDEVTAEFHAKQINHRRTVQAPLERKFRDKQVQESYVKKSREKYESDCVRIRSYNQQITFMTGSDLQKVQQKLARTQQTLQGNEKDYARFTKELLELLPTWAKEWKEFCDSCQDLEEERLDFMKDIIWAYANAISTVCVADDLSCERIRTALDQLETEKDLENFVNVYGTGNLISQPPEFVPSDAIGEAELPRSPVLRYAEHQRVSKRRPMGPYDNTVYDINTTVREPDTTITPANNRVNGDTHPRTDASTITQTTRTSRNSPAPPPQTSPPNHPPPPVPETSSVVPSTSTAPVTGTSTVNPGTAASSSRTSHRVSQPLPNTPHGGDKSRVPAKAPTPPPLGTQQPNRILFYVKALYDYQATIPEEFDFQAGDVIAVTATPDDGWWIGELLDEKRREEGRDVFPSNFVCLF